MGNIEKIIELIQNSAKLTFGLFLACLITLILEHKEIVIIETWGKALAWFVLVFTFSFFLFDFIKSIWETIKVAKSKGDNPIEMALLEFIGKQEKQTVFIENVTLENSDDIEKQYIFDCIEKKGWVSWNYFDNSYCLTELGRKTLIEERNKKKYHK
ncbi:hypothetical protein HWI77_03205 [Acinetobacter venetianus]|uniref:hypothetical protein n=1 Tax=Acinetobacter venetianus TaxID=52133 RepID=UPI0017852F9F|nr:hypothetical protein HWI77_03205 [Acinetobacter venetianus]